MDALILFLLADWTLEARAREAEWDTIHLPSDKWAPMATYRLGAHRALWGVAWTR